MIAGWPGEDAMADAIRACLEGNYTPPEWHQDAACSNLSPAEADRLFFFDGGNLSNEARALCAGCPVQAECYDAGKFELGVWGGLTERQRLRARGLAS